MTLLNMSTGNRVHAIDKRGDDLYQTPPVAVRCLLQREHVEQNIWEPACGPGAIVRELQAAGRTVTASDLVDYDLADAWTGIDFLMENSAPVDVTTIVTNPPFKNAEAFVEKAIELVPVTHMLLRVAFLEGLRWERSFGQHLSRVLIFTPRLPMMHREGWEGPKTNSPAMAFAWFTFRRDWQKQGGQPTVEWVNWKKLEAQQ